MRTVTIWLPPRRLLAAGIVSGIFAILTALFFWKVLLYPAQYHIPYDLHDYHYSLAHEIFSELKEGIFPLWDRYSYSGMPLAGNIQAQLFYWPNLLALKISDWVYGALPYRMMEYQLIIHYVLAAMGAFLLARSFGLSPASAMLTGIVFTFGGFMASMTQHLGLINGAAWVPWAFFFARKYIDTRKLIYGAAGAGTLAMVILAGFPALIIAVFLYLGIISLIVVLYHSVVNGFREGLRYLVISLIILALAVGLSAVQLLPAFEANHYSYASQQHERVGLAGIAREGFMTLLVPTFYGAGGDHYWGNQDLTHAYQYLGIGTLILSLICLFAVKRKDILLAITLTVFSLLWTLGEDFHVSTLVWKLMPSNIRGGIYVFCGRLFFDLGMALMAGIGLETLKDSALDQRKVSRIKTVLWAVTVVLVGFALTSLVFHHLAHNAQPKTEHRIMLIRVYQGINAMIILALAYGAMIYSRLKGRLQWRFVASFVLLVTFAELFTFGASKRFNTFASQQISMHGPEMVDGRTYPLDLLKSDPDYRQGKYMRIDTWHASRIWCTASRLWRLENANGDDPLLPLDYRAFRLRSSRISGNRRFLIQSSAANCLNLLSVKYVVVGKELHGFQPPENLQLVQDHYYRIYENKSFLPRAFFVSRVAFEPDLKSVLDRISSPGFSGLEYVVTDDEKIRQSENWSAAEVVGPATVQIVSHQPNEIVVSVNNPCPGFLVLNEVFFPGWKASVDGRGEQIFRANGIFRGVRLSAGSHRVTMSYRPHCIYYGALISLASIILILYGLLRQRHRQELKDAQRLTQIPDFAEATLSL